MPVPYCPVAAEPVRATLESGRARLMPCATEEGVAMIKGEYPLASVRSLQVGEVPGMAVRIDHENVERHHLGRYLRLCSNEGSRVHCRRHISRSIEVEL